MRWQRTRDEGKRQKGTRRGNRTTAVLWPGTAQPWAVITNHTFHFWGDISLLVGRWKGIRQDLKSQKESKSCADPCLLGKKDPAGPGPGAAFTQSLSQDFLYLKSVLLFNYLQMFSY